MIIFNFLALRRNKLLRRVCKRERERHYWKDKGEGVRQLDKAMSGAAAEGHGVSGQAGVQWGAD